MLKTFSKCKSNDVLTLPADSCNWLGNKFYTIFKHDENKTLKNFYKY